MAVAQPRPGYPEPCYPRYILQPKPSVEDMVPIAKERVKKTYDFPAMGPIREGDKILFCTYPHQDLDVVEAIKRACLEAGAARAEHMFLTDYGMPLINYSTADGWRDLTDRLIPLGQGEYATMTPHINALKAFLSKDPDFNAIYMREGGHAHVARELNRAVPGMGDNVRGNWLYSRFENLISRANSLSDELHRMIDRKLAASFANVAEVRVTDPEGTDMRWEVTDEEAQLWSRNCIIAGHVLGSTFQCLRGIRSAAKMQAGQMRTVREVPFEDFTRHAARHLPTVNGVIAATSNHTGFTPRIEVTVERGMVTNIKGGGKYGELWSEAVEKYKDYHYPGYPGKGWSWFNDATICTNPKGFRSREGLWSYNDPHTNLEERRRCGIIHWGFGAEHYIPVFLDYAREHRLPIMHAPHMHSFFADYEVKLRPSGEWKKIIDKGRLTLLDEDPDVQRLASIFGDPKDVLKYEWIPAIPGINCAGDYEKFSKDPVPWIAKEAETLACPSPED